MKHYKILVIDDESRMRKLVRDFLTKKGYAVLEAGNGEEAMEIFYEDKEIDLLILDVMMPKMDGWEVCREVRKTSKVFISGILRWIKMPTKSWWTESLWS